MKTINEEMQTCIDACYDAITACKVCLNQHMGEPDMKRCHQLCLDCIDISTACASMCAVQSGYLGQISKLCAQICKDCAEECGKFDSDVCKECAQQCKRCADLCKEMAA